MKITEVKEKLRQIESHSIEKVVLFSEYAEKELTNAETYSALLDLIYAYDIYKRAVTTLSLNYHLSGNLVKIEKLIRDVLDYLDEEFKNGFGVYLGNYFSIEKYEAHLNQLLTEAEAHFEIDDLDDDQVRFTQIQNEVSECVLFRDKIETMTNPDSIYKKVFSSENSQLLSLNDKHTKIASVFEDFSDLWDLFVDEISTLRNSLFIKNSGTTKWWFEFSGLSTNAIQQMVADKATTVSGKKPVMKLFAIFNQIKNLITNADDFLFDFYPTQRKLVYAFATIILGFVITVGVLKTTHNTTGTYPQLNFDLNPNLEKLISSKLRSAIGADNIVVDSPVPGAEFLSTAGKTNISFKVKMAEKLTVSDSQIIFRIFANNEIDFFKNRSIYDRKLSPEQIESNEYTFEYGLVLYLSPGLYYFTFEMQDVADPLFIGKFYIDRIND